MSNLFKSEEFKAISAFYGDKVAKRSQVPLINHIKEGMAIMQYIGASEEAIRAYMIHPMFQNDDDLTSSGLAFASSGLADPYVIALTMEYRQRANAWLSDKIETINNMEFRDIPGPTSGNIRAVRHMLIADKVQNYKDFLKYHAETHARSKELDVYFKVWLKELGVNDEMFQEFSEVASKA